jgi:hypothetical protein
MENDRRVTIFNTLTIVVLAATVCLVGFYGLVAINVLNPFPPPTPVSIVSLPTPTNTSVPGPSTRTPTPIPTITPTPGPTNTRTPTLTPSVTPTWPPTKTPTPTPPRVTRSPWPFTYEVSLGTPQLGCGWTGVGGHVQDLDGNPLQGYPVHVWGAGIDVVVSAGADAGLNTRYGHQAAWEQFFDASPKPMEVRVQLHDPYRSDHLPVSEEIVIDFPGYCGAALGYVVFTQNH